jgi:hypothetical protein
MYNIVRIEKDDDIRRVLESLLTQLASRNILERNTVQNIVDEGKPSIIPVHNQNNTFSQSILRNNSKFLSAKLAVY